MDDMIMVDVYYSCTTCKIVKRKTWVRERAADEQLQGWMNTIGRVVMQDHLRTSPKCRSETVDLTLPVTPNSYMGRAIRH